jgi:hypothetical protein
MDDTIGRPFLRGYPSLIGAVNIGLSLIKFIEDVSFGGTSVAAD